MAKGRPPKVKVDDILAAVDPYLKTAKPPIVAEFAHSLGITREYLYELAATRNKKGDPRLSYAIKWISEAKEIDLERGGLSGDYAQSVAIFSLKQLGWSDKGQAAEASDDGGADDPLSAALRGIAEGHTGARD